MEKRKPVVKEPNKKGTTIAEELSCPRKGDPQDIVHPAIEEEAE